MSGKKLKEMDKSTLARCLQLEDKYDAKIGAYNIGQRNHLQKLQKMGMLEYDGRTDCDIDNQHDFEVPIYKLTKEGRKMAEKLDREELT